MKTKILHNPRCSKSRATLELLEESSVRVDIVEYLKEPPSVEELDEICTLLGVEPIAIVRTNESLFSELGLSATDDRSRSEWLKLLAEHPKLIERPIVVRGDKAVIGRPPENVLAIL